MNLDTIFRFSNENAFRVTDVVAWYLQTLVLPPTAITCLLAFLQYVCRPNSKIRFVACYSMFLMWTTSACLLVWPLFIFTPRTTMKCLYGAILLGPQARILGIKFELKQGERLSYANGPAIVVSNHQSFFDVLGMFTIWHVMRNCTAIARKKVFWVWPFGLIAWLAGVVFIDRIPSYNKTYEKVNNAAKYICKQKAKLWIFAEGTRNPKPEVLLPFKKGAFHVAISSQIPIIPVVYSPYYFINGKSLYFGRGKIIMEVLEPISTKGFTLKNMDDLMAKVYKLMSDKNDQLRTQFKKLKEADQLPDCCNL